ncbi:DUF4136 domain-containing protein [Echinicola rosea]|uniref:DUF4136 domain-containing protein n=1 Tax=Echinicola rosea TaxID=1807691 RepID=A0ABQ1VAI3_9BACT|nr:DUF4136 domain-containing protein [Echinicola rosea]GGF48413.1 hypothetical protein GCM10011339_41280 [Echinicola rosea]
MMQFKSLLFFGSLLIISACTPQGADYIEDLDIALTFQDPEVNYDNYSSYHLPDTVVLISNDDNTEISSEMEGYILSEVNQQFRSMGWDRNTEPVSDGSDVVLMVSVVDLLNVQYVSWWDYWGWWPGWGYYPYPPDGWYPYYPGGCCYFGGVYSYREGTIIIEMVDPNSIEAVSDGEPDRLPVMWAGGLNGVLQGDENNIKNRIDRGMDQIFTDSPYLNK